MIVDCGACSAQNFVSRERLAARDVPPICWKCGRALAIDAGPRVSKKTVEIRPFKSPPPGRTIGLVWRKRAPFPETFERLAATLKASLPSEVEPV